MPQKAIPIWMKTGESQVKHNLDIATGEAAELDSYLDLLRASNQRATSDSREVDVIRDQLKHVENDLQSRTLFGPTAKAGGIKPLDRAETDAFLARIRFLREQMRVFRVNALERYRAWRDQTTIQKLPSLGPPVVAGGGFGSGSLLGSFGIGGNGIGGGSIGGTGHGFGGGGPNSTDRHGIPGMDFGKRPGDDDGRPGAPGVHGGGYQGNYGNGFFGTGFLHPGVGPGGGLTGGGTPSGGGGISGGHKTGAGTTGGSYVDATSRNDARASGSERGVDKGGDKPSGDNPTEGTKDQDGMPEVVDSYPVESGAPSTPEEEGARQEEENRIFFERTHDPRLPGGSEPVDGGGGDTGGDASESRPTFTGYQPRNHGGAVDALTIGVGVHHLPGSPISYISATSDVGSIGGTTDGFGGTNPNVRVYRPDPEASGGGGGPRGYLSRPSDDAGSPRGPGARIARQVAEATRVRTRLR